jgi:GT2 family glycosyltransferase
VGVDLTVSIINTNNRDLLRDCLRSIFENKQHISMKVYVVDNACTDGSAEIVRAEFPQVRLIRNETRLGFCVNHNQVLCIAQGRYCLILNEDTLIQAGALDCLVEFMDRHSDAGVAGPMLLNADGSFQSSYYNFPTLWSEFLLNSGLGRLIYDPYYPSRPLEKSQEVVEADWVSGACLMVRRETIDQVGFLDERFYVYSEETDWCYRMRSAGWKVYYVPDAQVLHLGGQAWKQLDDFEHVEHRVRTRLRVRQADLQFFVKHYSKLSSFSLRLLLGGVSALKVVFWMCVYLFGAARRTAQLEVRGNWQMLRMMLAPEFL